MASDLHKSLEKLQVLPIAYFVVARSHEIEGNWEQLSNAFEEYDKAKDFRDTPYHKKKHPYAFIVASLDDKYQKELPEYLQAMFVSSRQFALKQISDIAPHC